VPVKRDGELVFFDAFDLAVAEHRMMHGVANRESRSRSNSQGFFDWRRFVVNGFRRLSSWLGSDHGTFDRSLSPRGCGGIITEMGGGRSSCVLLGQRAPTPTSSCRSPGERQFNLGNCVVARDAIICLELESDTRIGLADEERCLTR